MYYHVPDEPLIVGMHKGGAYAAPFWGSVLEYVASYTCCLLGDLWSQGFKRHEIEDGIDDSLVRFAPWPLRDPRTHLIWLPEAQGHLERLAIKVMQRSLEDGEMRLTSAFDPRRRMHPGRALAGIIYARDTSAIREINDGSLTNPFYVRVNSRADMLLRQSA